MSSAYGIIVTMKAKEGKVDDLIEYCKHHFVRQFDGREPKATHASLIMPTPDAPNTVRLFEQWADTDGLENHRSPDNVNTQLFIKNVPPMLDGEMEVSEAPMVHYSLKE
mmetsp:Transcript_27864/g.75810  ORF Transcript_27864/g.75810 Transcript_27864/m.75810 type:complete len:109 (+) Transcript_27864:241-567(+)|eukprot:CAMPEP_0172355812 /NCGR_PEP_ID=MMETSP1060-20121228/200_1 /TAXON_ID=37318 /ORGANISM="Pseudo-nitzschia pungens, Strain cf. cingulata" /LENGTH=108 /DNA_ID=CAMNT_0013075661 /DNA_START=202 /DNA_END=528 /DNA_ORIENTATION=-